ncbi:DUF6233 domain-containing protein [Streptomyces vinaceus]|uniref:DUF6233 domain-containing protein n=1 Tax=Streptomyces vinaceus TaxID=1960 RepID=UPI0037F50528
MTFPTTPTTAPAASQREVAAWAPSQTGPYCRCPQPTCRYGVGGSPLCPACRRLLQEPGTDRRVRTPPGRAPTPDPRHLPPRGAVPRRTGPGGRGAAGRGSGRRRNRPSGWWSAASRRESPPSGSTKGDCWDTGHRCTPANAQQARTLLAQGVTSCIHCRPDTALGMLE